MPKRPPRPCPRHTPAGPCPYPVGTTRPGQYTCDEHDRGIRRATDTTRGTFHERGYQVGHRSRFRAGVLAKHPDCQCVDPAHRAHRGVCLRPATDADHYPMARTELKAAGLDPDDPQYGRGLCHSCHSWHTARTAEGRGFRS